ncbi:MULTISPECIES: phosphate signaling complex PhoU family protein [Nocardia]|uniref:phosphate signaling complex PhoU family protein n=1 Tax=Nocardia TaxID=1817 RepID=UPI002457B68C|nr:MULTISPECIES: PhoU domain-containing protein [Nocardia]
MRTQFTNELVALTADLTQMCRITHEAAERMTDALVEADLTATYEVFALDERLQAMYSACEARTVVLLALQAPVARDLRHVVTAIQIAGELSRIGHLFSRVADQVYRSHPEPVAATAVLEPLGAMAQLAVAATARTEHAVTTGRHSAAGEDAPAAMQALNQKLHTALSSTGDSTDTAIALALVGHRLAGSLEHTDRIARLIHFLDTGVPPTAQIVPDDEAAS